MTRLARARVGGRAVHHGWLEGATFRPLLGDAFGGQPHPGADPVPLDEVELLSPTVPRTVLVMWRAFRQSPEDVVDHPPHLAVKATGAGPGADQSPVVVPGLLRGRLAAEAELAVVIGRTARSVSPRDAWDSIAGFTVVNDVTAPELLHPSGEWPAELPKLVSGASLAKSFDTFCPIGPWIETAVTEEMIRDGLDIITRVNGQERQRGSTSRFKFPVADVVSYASHVLTLTAGDVISLGTVGPVLVDEGDTVECEVEGVGVLHNTFVGGPKGGTE
ncbi:fumarylacetoacetate hydrolase family protein [Dactylosporangium sp. CA-092794]|uniref:fumarylacetoacetate hydrolase family protein n=1 Tax=Dactylosporangium sp. CA-092794 TaxID=3239929 RepID=UPI003D927076